MKNIILLTIILILPILVLSAYPSSINSYIKTWNGTIPHRAADPEDYQQPWLEFSATINVANTDPFFGTPDIGYGTGIMRCHIARTDFGTNSWQNGTEIDIRYKYNGAGGDAQVGSCSIPIPNSSGDYDINSSSNPDPLQSTGYYYYYKVVKTGNVYNVNNVASTSTEGVTFAKWDTGDVNTVPRPIIIGDFDNGIGHSELVSTMTNSEIYQQLYNGFGCWAFLAAEHDISLVFNLPNSNAGKISVRDQNNNREIWCVPVRFSSNEQDFGATYNDQSTTAGIAKLRFIVQEANGVVTNTKIDYTQACINANANTVIGKDVTEILLNISQPFRDHNTWTASNTNTSANGKHNWNLGFYFAHELGHILGIGHVYSLPEFQNYLMYSTYRTGTNASYLTSMTTYDDNSFLKLYCGGCEPNEDDVLINSEVSSISGNYPNPFNPETTIKYNLIGKIQTPQIEIYNIKGQLVKSLDLPGKPGLNTIVWNGKSDAGKKASSGVYFYRLINENKTVATKKMLLLK